MDFRFSGELKATGLAPDLRPKRVEGKKRQARGRRFLIWVAWFWLQDSWYQARLDLFADPGEFEFGLGHYFILLFGNYY